MSSSSSVYSNDHGYNKRNRTRRGHTGRKTGVCLRLTSMVIFALIVVLTIVSLVTPNWYKISNDSGDFKTFISPLFVEYGKQKKFIMTKDYKWSSGYVLDIGSAQKAMGLISAICMIVGAITAIVAAVLIWCTTFLCTGIVATIGGCISAISFIIFALIYGRDMTFDTSTTCTNQNCHGHVEWAAIIGYLAGAALVFWGVVLIFIGCCCRKTHRKTERTVVYKTKTEEAPPPVERTVVVKQRAASQPTVVRHEVAPAPVQRTVVVRRQPSAAGTRSSPSPAVNRNGRAPSRIVYQ